MPAPQPNRPFNPTVMAARIPTPDDLAAVANAVRLTPTEREVLTYLYEGGHTYRQIAIELGIAVATVQFHSSNVQRKLGARCKSAVTWQVIQWLAVLQPNLDT